jgi:hypothetical protein
MAAELERRGAAPARHGDGREMVMCARGGAKGMTMERHWARPLG